ncbi:MAG: molybdopterin-guanine dinucleotide biosynthesis protein B [Thermoplasmata archaeon]|nr:molybdopterin-guanine dinucleotide biosynthesis protein B [Thermoplasmata archaeon]
MIIVSLIGLKKSGKTTCVEALVREFKSRRMKVGTVKSMVHSNFTIDKEGKDTCRHQQAGADFVVSLSKDELAYIEKRPNRSRLDEFIRFIPEDTGILICEGLEDADPRIIRILVAKSSDFLAETFAVRGAQENVIALTGIIASETKENDKYPIFDCTVNEDVVALANRILENSI